MPSEAFTPNLQALAFMTKPEQKVQDPFGNKTKGKDQSRLPSGNITPKYVPDQVSER